MIGTYKGQNDYIRTNIFGDQTKPVLVLMHGYGGSGALFYRILKSLSEHFCVITIDIPGMGASARPNDACWKKITPLESNKYFVDKIEKWRIAMGKEFYKNEKEFTDLFWMGHSFGGHVSGHYAL